MWQLGLWKKKKAKKKGTHKKIIKATLWNTIFFVSLQIKHSYLVNITLIIHNVHTVHDFCSSILLNSCTYTINMFCLTENLSWMTGLVLAPIPNSEVLLHPPDSCCFYIYLSRKKVLNCISAASSNWMLQGRKKQPLKLPVARWPLIMRS